MTISGVYMIQNIVNGKMYIGSSKNINKRFIEHRLHLRKNKHYNTHLQRAWNKHTENNFKFIILEEISFDKSKLKNLEQKYLDIYKPYDHEIGYNMRKHANSCAVANKCNYTSEFNIKTKSKPVYQYDLNGKFLKEWSSESEASRFFNGHPGSIGDVCRKTIKTCYGFVWRHKSEIKNKNKILDYNEIKNACIKAILQYDMDGNFIKEWKSTWDAAKFLNLDGGDICLVCQKSKNRRSCGGFIWRYKEEDKIKQKIVVPEIKRTYKMIEQFNLGGELIKEWPSIREAYETLKISKGVIWKSLTNKSTKLKYYFKYKKL